MNKIQAFTAAVVLAAATLVAAILGGTSSAAAQTPRKGALVSVHKTALGKVLVDARGHTLYLFEKDRKGMSLCNGACAAYWPAIVSTAKPRAGAGVRASLLGRTRRADGRRQVTYAGHPLYYYAPDRKQGQISGQALDQFGAPWYALAPAGREIHTPGS
ncbi:MAG: COG4315 family predicted lipoprotein [Gaiellaceae bacterium]